MTKRYRVWCLSRDDEEEHGSEVVGYDDIFSARKERGVLSVPSASIGTPAEAVKAYADYMHGNRDGWESSWPLLFRVRCPDGEVLDFEVFREYVPEFSASPVKPLVAATHVLWGGRVLCEDERLLKVPGHWPAGQRWISLKDVADGAEDPPDRCETCWRRAPGLAVGLKQVGAGP